MNHADLALSHFQEGFSCAQAVLVAFAPDFGLDRDLALKIAAAFGGGMGRTGGTCGAASGALMALGLKDGATRGEDKTTKERAYSRAREFLEQFQARHGAITCPGLLGHDIGTAAGMEAAREQGLFKSFCPRLVEDAVKIVEEMWARDERVE
ncbi:MAG: C_GCAxxG_C_C family protein [Chloroflexi bacterium]|nr:C_GCAxxG_C_C family protein [Chloroflexota bacterium]